jgi:eukaryotic-like serine/threonine-protein kinase
MTPERWQQIRDVLEKALELAPSERSAFLNRACSSDSSLRQEVETLIDSSDDVRSSFLQSSTLRVTLTSGTKVGDYEVKSLLGSGGMGEVYRARDSRLGRDVAIKVLPSFFSADSERLRRFEQEARAAAALSHPNILAVHQMGTYEGAPYLVSELLEGETLREQIKRGHLAVRKAIDYGVQIARGLAAANEKGIVHRDLKPENLFVTKDGRLKILDFGLAKLTQPQSSSERSALTQTEGTEAGVVMGTVGYMSPEQVRGQSADHRADIFAFGAILYEMLTGKRAFQKPTSPETMTAILNEDPPGISQVIPNVAPALQRVVHRCLEKNPEQRFQSASDLAFALDALSESGVSSHSAAAASAGTDGRKRWKIIVPAAVALLALSIGGYFYFHRTPKLTDKDTIVLADFANSTGDPVFDGTLRQGLSSQLEQSPFLNLLSDERIAQTLSLMTQPKDARLTHELAREVCQRTASAAALDGSIAQIGTQYLLTLKAVNCLSGESLASTQAQASDKNHVLEALGKLASEIRSKLGESLASVQKYDAPPESATTSSLEALKAYSLGHQEFIIKSDFAAAIPLFQRAISLDPNFAMAYARLGTSYFDLSENVRAAENTRKAFELRDRASERERFYIDSHYEQFVTGNLEAARKTYELWAQTYPRDDIPPGNLSTIYGFLASYEKSLAAAQEALKLNPGNATHYGDLLDSYLQLNRLDEAKTIAQQAQAHNLDSSQLYLYLYLVNFLQHDAAGMERQAAGLMGKPAIEDQVLYFESDTAAYGGQFAEARELTRRAAESAQRADEKETAADYDAEAAVREAVVGNATLAKPQAQAALALSNGRDVEAMSAIALALAGDSTQAMRLADDLGKRFPEDTIVQVNYLPMIHAAAALRGNDPGKAIEVLAATAPYELGVTTQNLNFLLYAIYMRGEAYLAMRQGAAAAAEFQKIIDHPGLVVNEPIGALAHLQLGRAYATAGDSAKAKAAYKDFLTLWKDADPEIPILKEAKAEYAKLQ